MNRRVPECGYKVVVTGEDSDELFGGYPMFKRDMFKHGLKDESDRRAYQKALEKNNKIFKFQCNSGYKVRYGTTKFKYYLLQEPRFLKTQGYLKHCMFCGMPIYINDDKVFHFKYKCNQYQKQEIFKLLKVDNFWAIISRDFIYGVLDDLHSCILRLPGTNQKKDQNTSLSELWLINQKARKEELIESDRLLPLKAEEFIA